MKNKGLAHDYFMRAGNRLAALEVLMERQSYADVVREAQEAVELCLKALLRQCGVEVPRLHDVGDVLKEQNHKLPGKIRPHAEQLASVSKNLRRDRELAFYGTEDLTPSEFYEEEDARSALKNAKWVHSICQMAFAR